MKEITLQAAFQEFLDFGSSSWSPATSGYYKRNIRFFLQFLEDTFSRPPEQILVGELPDDILLRYVLQLRVRRRYASHPDAGSMHVSGVIKSNTVNTYMRAVKVFINFLRSRGYTDISSEGLRLPKSDNNQIVPLMASEVRRIDALFDPVSPGDLRNLCMVHLMLDAGLRSSEVLRLNAADVLFDSNSIVINQAKGNKSRVVLLAPPLRGYLKQYYDMQQPSGILFRKFSDHKPVTVSVMRSLFIRIVRNTGIDRLHPHLLRHTFATSYIIGGGNLETLRLLMGHSDYTVTRLYLHLASQYRILGSDIYRLDPVFFKSGY